MRTQGTKRAAWSSQWPHHSACPADVENVLTVWYCLELELTPVQIAKMLDSFMAEDAAL